MTIVSCPIWMLHSYYKSKNPSSCIMWNDWWACLHVVLSSGDFIAHLHGGFARLTHGVAHWWAVNQEYFCLCECLWAPSLLTEKRNVALLKRKISKL